MLAQRSLLSGIITVIILFGYGHPLGAQMIAEITEDIATEFGIYHPFPVEITPSCQSYVIEPGFSNVSNFDQFTFTAQEESLLQRNGFVAVPDREGYYSGYWEIYDIYNECREKGIPIFVTADALLHTYHRLYDYILKTIELEHFYEDLQNLTQLSFLSAEDLYQAASDSLVEEAARRNLAYFAVAARMMGYMPSLPAEVEDLVQAEFDLIENQAESACSPIFEYVEDYTQYAPRGHYTESDSLRQYFKTMMWYGRMTCAADYDILGWLDWEDIQRETIQALLILKILHHDAWARSCWENIYQPTVFFVGRTDDLNLYLYENLAQMIYGQSFYSLPIDDYGQEAQLDAFIFMAQELQGPLIDTEAPKGFRLMGQRFTPDSYVLDQLVGPCVNDRSMPKGLDVMAVLGSERAYQILDEIYHETNYSNYVEQLDSLHNKLAGGPDSTWAQNLYWNWLYCLMPFLFSKGDGYPFFMNNEAWCDRELNTALGSWTELRHDTILYAKSSWYTGFMPSCGLVQGYVEPNPHLYARLASLANLMSSGLWMFDYWGDDFIWRLDALRDLLLNLKVIAEKELTAVPLTFEDYMLICNIGETIEELVTFEEWCGEGPVFGFSEDQMPVVVDVHTDASSGTCLEEGVGYPLNVYVIAEIEGTLKMTRGALFSYYEFPQSVVDRLSDEAWQDMLTDPDPPMPPLWTSSFWDTSRSLVNQRPEHYYWGKKGMSSLSLSLTPQSPMVGDIVQFHVVASDTLAQLPTLEVICAHEDTMVLELSSVETTPEPLDFAAHINTSSWDPGLIRTRTTGVFKGDWGAPTVQYDYAFHLQPGVSVPETEQGEDHIPGGVRLLTSYPNPFNQCTTISFFLSGQSSGYVTLEIYNLMGQRVRTLNHRALRPGHHNISWDGKSDAGAELASGVYFCRLQSSRESRIVKLVLIQ